MLPLLFTSWNLLLVLRYVYCGLHTNAVVCHSLKIKLWTLFFFLYHLNFFSSINVIHFFTFRRGVVYRIWRALKTLRSKPPQTSQSKSQTKNSSKSEHFDDSSEHEAHVSLWFYLLFSLCKTDKKNFFKPQIVPTSF